MAYGRTADAHAFMERSGIHSTKGSRRGFVDVETGVSPADLLTPAQQRDNLKRKHAALGTQRSQNRAQGGSKEEWQRLGREMQEIQQQMGVLNAAIPKREPANFNEAFVLCAKTKLLPLEYERIAEAARRRMMEVETA